MIMINGKPAPTRALLTTDGASATLLDQHRVILLSRDAIVDQSMLIGGALLAYLSEVVSVTDVLAVLRFL